MILKDPDIDLINTILKYILELINNYMIKNEKQSFGLAFDFCIGNTIITVSFFEIQNVVDLVDLTNI